VNLRFPGQYYDAESGLHYNWNRYYDPRIGRYVTSDPIGLASEQYNTYLYAKANPLYWTDILGLKDIIVVDAGWGGSPTENGAQYYVLKPGGGYYGPYKGSTFPDNPKECATIASGQFPFVVFKHPKKGMVPYIRGNVPLMTLRNPNPNSNSARGTNGAPTGTADEVLIHQGYNTYNGKPGKGSCACSTVSGAAPFQEFSGLFTEGETGTYIVIRSNLDTGL
jgi:RHS repeat-associated protein